MFRRLRETTPGALVPLAWVFMAVALTGGITDYTVLMAHVTMAGIMAVFIATGWSEMSEGALRAWRTVILLGLPVTVAGAASFLIEPGTAALQTVAIVGWMLLPAWGLWDTAGRLPNERHTQLYLGGATACVVGAGLYIVGSVVGGSLTMWLFGIALTGIGQTVGIVLAVVSY